MSSEGSRASIGGASIVVRTQGAVDRSKGRAIKLVMLREHNIPNNVAVLKKNGNMYVGILDGQKDSQMEASNDQPGRFHVEFFLYSKEDVGNLSVQYGANTSFHFGNDEQV